MEADRMLTSVEPYTSFRPKRDTTLPRCSFRPLIAPATMPMEEKLAKDTRTPTGSRAARRQFGRHFLQLHHCHELVGNQLGGHDAANLQGFVFRNPHDPCERIEEVAEDFWKLRPKMALNTPLSAAIRAMKPISIAATIIATLKPAGYIHPAFRRSSGLRAGCRGAALLLYWCRTG